LSPTWKATAYRSSLDLDGNLELTVFGMKVWRRMISVVHPNDDAKKSRYFGHGNTFSATLPTL
jgi:hypothetical protein